VAGGALLALAAGMIAGGCATGGRPQFEDSNQLFLERTVSALDIEEAVGDALPHDGKVCLVSLEKEESLDNPVISIIEDGVIKKLLERGYTVYERDSDVLKRLVSEKSGSNYRITHFPEDVTISSVSGRAGVTTGSGLWGVQGGYLQGGFGGTHIAGVGADTFLTFDTQLKPADYLISYRVLECGLVYRKGSDLGRKKREGLVRLHLRIQDTSSGEIKYAGNITGELEDEIDKSLVRHLSDFHYSFYSRDLPVSRGYYTGSGDMDEELKSEQREEAFIVGGVLAALAAVLIATSD
jgi:hypothetical protein